MKLIIDLQGAQTESRYRGIGRQTRALATAIIEVSQAHDVNIVLNSSLQEGIDELITEYSKVLPRKNIKLFKTPGSVYEHDPNNLWRMRSAELARECFLSSLQPDVVHVTSLFEGVLDDAVTSIGLMHANHLTAATLFDLIPLYDEKLYLNAGFMRRFCNCSTHR